MLLSGTLNKIKEHVAKLDVPATPVSLTATAQAGGYVLVNQTAMQQMMIFIEGITGLADELVFQFKIKLGDSWFDWKDGSGELVSIVVAGNAKEVFGPFQCPMKVSDVRMYEVGGVSSEGIELLRETPEIDDDILSVVPKFDGSYTVGLANGYVRNYDNTDTQQWAHEVSAGAKMQCVALDTSGNYYFGDDAGYVHKVAADGSSVISSTLYEGDIVDIYFYDGYLYLACNTVAIKKVDPSDMSVVTIFLKEGN